MMDAGFFFFKGCAREEFPEIPLISTGNLNLRVVFYPFIKGGVPERHRLNYYFLAVAFILVTDSFGHGVFWPLCF